MICCFHFNKRQLLTKSKEKQTTLKWQRSSQNMYCACESCIFRYAPYLKIQRQGFHRLVFEFFSFSNSKLQPEVKQVYFSGATCCFFFYFHLQVLFNFAKSFAEMFLSLYTLTSISVQTFSFFLSLIIMSEQFAYFLPSGLFLSK